MLICTVQHSDIKIDHLQVTKYILDESSNLFNKYIKNSYLKKFFTRKRK